MASKRIVRLGTRKSLLAMTQSRWVKEQIEAAWPDVAVELVKVVTKGDKILDVPLAKVGGKGLFVKEIEEAMLDGRVDFAVHSLKDVPAELPQGLEVTVFPKREDPRDVLITPHGSSLDDLPEGAVVGTSSLRRMAQLRALRPDLEIKTLRGNLDTRLKKLDGGEYDAIVLAAAGLNRLGLAHRISSYFSPEILLPAVGQGALGIEFRSADTTMREILSSIHHEPTAIAVRAERAFLARLEGGCQVPIGAHAAVDGQMITLTGLVGDEEGHTIIKRSAQGSAEAAESLGRELADEILDAGGREILKELYAHGE